MPRMVCYDFVKVAYGCFSWHDLLSPFVFAEKSKAPPHLGKGLFGVVSGASSDGIEMVKQAG